MVRRPQRFTALARQADALQAAPVPGEAPDLPDAAGREQRLRHLGARAVAAIDNDAVGAVSRHWRRVEIGQSVVVDRSGVDG